MKIESDALLGYLKSKKNEIADKEINEITNAKLSLINEIIMEIEVIAK